jgi:hypothetical protein
MRESVGRSLDFLPPLPAVLPGPEAKAPSRHAGPRHEKLPSRRSGLTQKASVGGHRVFLQTGEYADGRLGEFFLHLPRESAFVRGLAECFAQALSLGLQHGVKLEEFVEALSLTRFGPSGLVEGDSTAERATSVVDYAMRALSANYLGRVLPEPEPDEDMRLQEREVAPMLPLDLPRRRGLRLVA